MLHCTKGGKEYSAGICFFLKPDLYSGSAGLIIEDEFFVPGNLEDNNIYLRLTDGCHTWISRRTRPIEITRVATTRSVIGARRTTRVTPVVHTQYGRSIRERTQRGTSGPRGSESCEYTRPRMPRDNSSKNSSSYADKYADLTH